MLNMIWFQSLASRSVRLHLEEVREAVKYIWSTEVHLFHDSRHKVWLSLWTKKEQTCFLVFSSALTHRLQSPRRLCGNSSNNQQFCWRSQRWTSDSSEVRAHTSVDSAETAPGPETMWRKQQGQHPAVELSSTQSFYFCLKMFQV